MQQAMIKRLWPVQTYISHITHTRNEHLKENINMLYLVRELNQITLLTKYKLQYTYYF